MHSKNGSDGFAKRGGPRRFLRAVPPAIALVAVGTLVTVQLATPTAVASIQTEPSPIERLATLLEVGYDTDTLLAGGLLTADVRTFYEAAMLETASIDSVAASLAAFRDAQSDLQDVDTEIRRLGLDDTRESDRASARSAVEAAETALNDAEASLAAAIADELDAQVAIGVLNEISTVASRRHWQIPVAWRLANFADDDAVKAAERLAAKVRTDPDAQLSATQAGLLGSIVNNADVSGATFRVQSGATAALQALSGFVADLQSGQ
jgi:hypothetical protein